MNKNKVLQWSPLFVIFLFFLPYIGEVGKVFFYPVGKYYYVILAILGLAEALARRYYLQGETEPRQLAYWVLRRFGIPCGIVAVAMVFSLLLCDNTVDNCAFAVVIAFFGCYFCTIPATKTFLRRLGMGAMLCLGAMALVTLLEQKASYFNPNSYGFISCALFLFASLYFYTGKKPFYLQPLFWVSLAVSFVLVFLVYRCETQLVSVVFFLAWMFFLPYILGSKKRFALITGGVFAFTLLLPVVAYILIQWGVLSTDFITRRGERWWDVFEAFKTFGLFRIVPGDAVPPTSVWGSIGPHNGYLDMATKYGIIPSLVVYIGMFLVVLGTYPAVKKNKNNQPLYGIVMTFVLMNSVESFFVGLTDCYYMVLALALLWNRQRMEKKRALPQKEV